MIGDHLAIIPLNNGKFIKCRNVVKNVTGFCARVLNRTRESADYKPNKYANLPSKKVVVVCPECKKNVYMICNNS